MNYEWQEARTAPQDGTQILGYFSNGEMHVVGIWEDVCYRELDSEDKPWSWPTHWLPLPTPPATPPAAGEGETLIPEMTPEAVEAIRSMPDDAFEDRYPLSRPIPPSPLPSGESGDWENTPEGKRAAELLGPRGFRPVGFYAEDHDTLTEILRRYPHMMRLALPAPAPVQGEGEGEGERVEGLGARDWSEMLMQFPLVSPISFFADAGEWRYTLDRGLNWIGEFPKDQKRACLAAWWQSRTGRGE